MLTKCIIQCTNADCSSGSCATRRVRKGLGAKAACDWQLPFFASAFLASVSFALVPYAPVPFAPKIFAFTPFAAVFVVATTNPAVEQEENASKRSYDDLLSAALRNEIGHAQKRRLVHGVVAHGPGPWLTKEAVRAVVRATRVDEVCLAHIVRVVTQLSTLWGP